MASTTALLFVELQVLAVMDVTPNICAEALPKGGYTLPPEPWVGCPSVIKMTYLLPQMFGGPPSLGVFPKMA